MDRQSPGRAKQRYSWREAFELITASSDEESARSSEPDSADSGDEADFIEGRDPSHDVYVYIHELLFVFKLEKSKENIHVT